MTKLTNSQEMILQGMEILSGVKRRKQVWKWKMLDNKKVVIKATTPGYYKGRISRDYSYVSALLAENDLIYKQRQPFIAPL